MRNPFISIAILLALAATAGALVFGLFALFKGGEFNRTYGNRAMRWRIIIQVIALALFTLSLILGR
jgi:hypothetical protein